MSKTYEGPYDWNGWERRRRLLAADNHCVYCSKLLSEYDATQDHVVPVSKGGTDDDDNIVLACYVCNMSKDNLLPLNFFMKRPEGRGILIGRTS